MHALEEVAAELGLSYGALRDRLRALSGLIEPHINRGKKGKIFLDNNGLYVLRRLVELERSGLSIADSAQAVRKELALESKKQKESQESPSANYPQTADKEAAVWQLVEQLRGENAFLKEQIAAKDQLVLRLQELLESRLPGEVTARSEASEEAGMEYLRRIVERQRAEIEELRRALYQLRMPWWRRLFGPSPAPSAVGRVGSRNPEGQDGLSQERLRTS